MLPDFRYMGGLMNRYKNDVCESGKKTGEKIDSKATCNAAIKRSIEHWQAMPE